MILDPIPAYMFFQASSFQRTELLEVEKDVQVGPQRVCRFSNHKAHRESGKHLNAQARVARVASFVSAMF